MVRVDDIEKCRAQSGLSRFEEDEEKEDFKIPVFRNMAPCSLIPFSEKLCISKSASMETSALFEKLNIYYNIRRHMAVDTSS
jgi:hypothetical protein